MPFAHPINRTLLLVAQPEYLATEDLFLIKEKIVMKAPDLQVLVVGRGDRAELIEASLWRQPTLTVSFGPLGRFKPMRGQVFYNEPIAKIDQFRQMTMAGITTPMTALFRLGMDLPAKEWGEFCILKPAKLEFTSTGRGLFLFRRQRLNQLAPSDLPPDHLALHEKMLVQSFVNTGPHFKVYRCLTLFGEVIYQNVSEDPKAHPPLDSSDEEIESLLPEPNRSQTVPRIDTDPDVMKFGSSIHVAFPGVPLLGCDIVRDHMTSRLYAIEVNAGGNVWHLSSPRTEATRSISKIQQYLRTFQSYDKAALALIRAARRHAR
jgi:hypothetical protein